MKKRQKHSFCRFFLFLLKITSFFLRQYSSLFTAMRRGKEMQTNKMTDKQIQNYSQKKKNDQLDRKKPILLRELENQLKHLDELDDQDFAENNDPYVNDSTLDRLQMISKEAVRLEIKEIQKLCNLAIGKRILNIELKKKKDQHNSKLQKKEKIELFFRENRIKRYDYDSLIQSKLGESRLIVKAYANGKGFIESDKIYKDEYQIALNQCNYMNTVKQVNKIFYANYTGTSNKGMDFTQVLLKFIWIPIILFVLLGITLPFISFLYEQVVLMALLALILVVLFYVSIKTFYDKPNQNNQIEQSISDVKTYFQILNQQFERMGKKIQWSCSQDFMYLQVYFGSGFPK